MAKIANVALTNTFEYWRQRSNEAFDRISQFAINNSRLYANTLVANNVLRAPGNTVLGGTGKRVIVNGTLTVNTSASFSGSISGQNITTTGNTVLGSSGKKTVINGTTFEANTTSSVIKAPTINAYREEVDVQTNVFQNRNLNLSQYNQFVLTLTRNVTLRLINPGTTGSVACQVKIIQANGGGWTPTFQGYNSANSLGTVYWPGNTVPSFSPLNTKSDIVSFSTYNGNGKYDGIVAAYNLSTT
jgi:hypothetical protein